MLMSSAIDLTIRDRDFYRLYIIKKKKC